MFTEASSETASAPSAARATGTGLYYRVPDFPGWLALGVAAIIASSIGGVAGFGTGAMMIPVIAWTLGPKATVQPLAANVDPSYTADGQLKMPERYREWVFLTSGLDMSYSPGAATAGHSMFDNVFVNPAAWRAFQQTGTWPDKTTLVLEVREALRFALEAGHHVLFGSRAGLERLDRNGAPQGVLHRPVDDRHAAGSHLFHDAAVANAFEHGNSGPEVTTVWRCNHLGFPHLS